MAGTLELRPLGEALGTEALGIDLSRLDDDTFVTRAAAGKQGQACAALVQHLALLAADDAYLAHGVLPRVTVGHLQRHPLPYRERGEVVALLVIQTQHNVGVGSGKPGRAPGRYLRCPGPAENALRDGHGEDTAPLLAGNLERRRGTWLDLVSAGRPPAAWQWGAA